MPSFSANLRLPSMMIETCWGISPLLTRSRSRFARTRSVRDTKLQANLEFANHRAGTRMMLKESSNFAVLSMILPSQPMYSPLHERRVWDFIPRADMWIHSNRMSGSLWSPERTPRLGFTTIISPASGHTSRSAFEFPQ